MSVKEIIKAAGEVKQKNIPFTLDKEEFYGLIERVANKSYAEYIAVEQIEAVNGMDIYELSDSGDKILIRATSGVAACVAFNKYLSSCCGYTVGAVTVSGSLPEIPPKVGKTVRHESKFHYRYLFNYCTFGYTYAFYSWKDWEKVLDWALLSGYNLVLNPIAQESVWYKVLRELGYTDSEAKNYLVGPAFMPWFLMMNMSGYEGNYPDWWFNERIALAGKFNKRLQAFGAGTMYAGYAGMVPDDFVNHFPESKPVNQGWWCGLPRPSYLLPDDIMFRRVAKLFYKYESEIEGSDKVHYYSADPFHEGLVPEGMNLESYALGVYGAMSEYDKNAVWVFQGWQNNPERKMLNVLDKSKVLITNLLSATNFNGGDNFADCPWMFCTVNNFGGQHIVRGNLAHILTKPFDGLDSDKYTMVGIGIMPEAVETDEIFFDVMASISFGEEKPEMKDYLTDFITRRYGFCNEELLYVWQTLEKNFYTDDAMNTLSESAFCCRPSLTVDRVTTWAGHSVAVDKSILVGIIKTLLKYYDACKDRDSYRYDLVDFTRQLLANDSWNLIYGLQNAYNASDKEAFIQLSKSFLDRFDLLERLLATSKKHLLGNWLERAKRLGRTELEKRWFEWNARTLITVWAPKAGDCLHDYAAREYSGMVSDFYKPRWERFISMAEISLLTGKPIPEYEVYDQEVTFSYDRKVYPCEPCGDIYTAVTEVIKEFDN